MILPLACHVRFDIDRVHKRTPRHASFVGAAFFWCVDWKRWAAVLSQLVLRVLLSSTQFIYQ